MKNIDKKLHVIRFHHTSMNEFDLASKELIETIDDWKSKNTNCIIESYIPVPLNDYYHIIYITYIESQKRELFVEK
jgi:hypothetical protein